MPCIGEHAKRLFDGKLRRLAKSARTAIVVFLATVLDGTGRSPIL